MIIVTRTKAENGKIKFFNKRAKVGEVEISNSTKLAAALATHLEKAPVEVKKIDELVAYANDLLEEGKGKRKAKTESKSTEKKERDPKDFNKDGKRRMRILPEQRVRKTERTEVEDELDNFCVYVKGSRRILEMKNLVKVAKENNIEVRGMDNGHAKMNVQNSLRAKYLRGENVYINGKQYSLDD